MIQADEQAAQAEQRTQETRSFVRQAVQRRGESTPLKRRSASSWRDSGVRLQ